MKAKLIKEKDWYDLYRIDEDGKRIIFASTQDYKQKLSLKNCQAIERGYDLDELARQEAEKLYDKSEHEDYNVWEYLVSGEVQSIKIGFQKALEILGDRKFTDMDIINAYEAGRIRGRDWDKGNENKHPICSEHLQSLQQNEWEVEILTEEVTIGDKYTPEPKPKFDEKGRLILKRV